ncbi:hypothetical protein [Ureaplasma zalophigenitalium]|uniref:Uncharacterized protein n=1 Tax=Ureaplasma zalophigenitalium TaxID=907723 RepID=A0ABT3BPU5_9BACT|nr:hypothetical protein [Ureaplasma zalophigenitalium]MCV3754252.1 hypothetical protein [Ureaplasma zalophigenitalium]
MKKNKNLSYDEFCKLPKVKQIFTPWFISALVIFIVFATIAFTMLGLLNVPFTQARTVVLATQAGPVLGDHLANVSGSEDSLMSYVLYDPHADYQEWLRAVKDVNAHGITFHQLEHLTDAQLHTLLEEKDLLMHEKTLTEVLHYMHHGLHSKVINHNLTWGFVIKVLSNPTNSWFSQWLDYLRVNDPHDSVEWTERLSLIQQYSSETQGMNYHAFYWVFIIFMMPNMITLIIIVVKLSTVLKPKLTPEQKEQYKLQKAQQKAQKKLKKQSSTITAGAL